MLACKQAAGVQGACPNCSRRTGQVEQLGEQRAAGGLALDARLGHAGRLQHHVAEFLVDALCALAQRLRHLAPQQERQPRLSAYASPLSNRQRPLLLPHAQDMREGRCMQQEGPGSGHAWGWSSRRESSAHA